MESPLGSWRPPLNGGLRARPSHWGSPCPDCAWVHPGDVHFSQDHFHPTILHPIALQWSAWTERASVQQKKQKRTKTQQKQRTHPNHREILSNVSGRKDGINSGTCIQFFCRKTVGSSTNIGQSYRSMTCEIF